MQASPGAPLATYDASYAPHAPERRALRGLELHWSAIFGGTVAGWGLFLLLSLFGLAAGISGLGPTAWTAAAMVCSAFAGSLLLVHLASERRSRSGRMEAIVAWGLSMIAGALFLLGALRTTWLAGDAGIATAGALLALLGALGGATLAARRRSGRAIFLPLHFWPTREDRRNVPGDFGGYDGGDEPTILPPTH
jgi:peptidoglycan/LPS O-acetylase OafA/YrhL